MSLLILILVVPLVVQIGLTVLVRLQPIPLADEPDAALQTALWTSPALALVEQEAGERSKPLWKQGGFFDVKRVA